MYIIHERQYIGIIIDIIKRNLNISNYIGRLVYQLYIKKSVFVCTLTIFVGE